MDYLKRISIIAFANIEDYLKQDGAGRMTVKSADELTEEQLIAVKRLDVTDGRVEIELHDKVEALNTLMEWLLLSTQQTTKRSRGANMKKRAPKPKTKVIRIHSPKKQQHPVRKAA